MNISFTVYSGFFLVATILSFFVAYLALQRRTVRSAVDLTFLMLSAGFWTLFLIFETSAVTVEEKILWAKVSYLGAVTTPVLFFVFILRFTGNDRFITRRNSLLLSVFPLITWIFALTNDEHHLLWSGYSVIYPESNIMEYYHGVWFWIGYMAYNYLLLILATVLVIRFILRHGKIFRSQGIIIFLAGFCPWIASIVYLTGLNPVPGLDLVPFSMILSGMLFSYSFLNNRFLDLVPVAREVLVETIPDGIIVLDEQNRIQDINQPALAFLGIPGQKVLGAPVETLPVSSQALLDALAGDDPVDQLELRSSGGIRSLRIQKKAIERNPGSRLIVLQDTTDQVIRENAILAGEERYRQLSTLFRLMADNMPDMLWAKDLEKKFIFTNKAICEQLLNAEDTIEPLGKTDLFFALRERNRFPDNDQWHTFGELCQDSDQVTINSGNPERFEEFGNVKGQFMYLDVRKAPIYDSKGEMIGVVGSARDITSQKQAAEEIGSRDKLLSAIAEATALLIQGDDLEAGVNGALEIIGKASGANRVYIFQNHNSPDYHMPLMSQMYEWTDGTVPPQIDNSFLQNVPYEVECPRWFETLSAGQVIAGNTRDFPDSERISLQAQDILSILVTPVFIDKSFWGFIGFDDCRQEREWSPMLKQILTAAANTIGAAYQRNKSQNELILAKEKAEESDRLKSAFLANMSHEIRTPMNGILGFAELLKEPDVTPEEQLRYIDIIEKSGIRLLSMINNIVDISKIESGQMQIHMTATNIHDLLKYLYSFFKPEAAAKGLTLRQTSRLLPGEMVIRTDKEKLYAILTNLVKNAIKFTSRGQIVFGVEKVGQELEFHVRDTGFGIQADRLDSIFNRFEQGHESNSMVPEGSGLGLSISKAYAEMLGGSIRVKSQPEVGSEFVLTIPYTHAD